MRTFFEFSQGLKESLQNVDPKLTAQTGTPTNGPPEEAHGEEETPTPPDLEAELKGFPPGVAMPARRLFQFLSHVNMNKQKSVKLLNLMIQHVSGDKLSTNLVRRTAANAMNPQV